MERERERERERESGSNSIVEPDNLVLHAHVSVDLLQGNSHHRLDPTGQDHKAQTNTLQAGSRFYVTHLPPR